jgi:hypothetical protein
MRNLAVAALVLALALTFTNNARALPAFGGYTEYYSDDTFTEIVGSSYTSCNGGIQSEGIRTNYYYSERWNCGGCCYSICSKTYVTYVDIFGDGRTWPQVTTVPEPCH